MPYGHGNERSKCKGAHHDGQKSPACFKTATLLSWPGNVRSQWYDDWQVATRRVDGPVPQPRPHRDASRDEDHGDFHFCFFVHFLKATSQAESAPPITAQHTRILHSSQHNDFVAQHWDIGLGQLLSFA